jgi:hypothetical protein
MAIRRLSLVLLVSALLSGCGPALGNSPPDISAGPQAWIDAPRPNSSYPLGPVQITAHGGHPGGIAGFELSINGESGGLPSPATGDAIVTLSHTWTPDSPGTYNLSLRSMSNAGEWSPPANTTVIIVGDLTASPEVPTPTFTLTSVPTPTFTPTLPPAAAVGQVEFVSVSTDALYYGAGSCGPSEITLQARAFDPAGIAVVVLFFRLESDDGEATDFSSKGMSAAGGDLYQVIVNPASEFGANTISNLGDGWFEYQAVVQNKANETKTRTQVFSNVTFAPCGGGAPPPPIIIFPPIILLPSPTPYIPVVH